MSNSAPKNVFSERLKMAVEVDFCIFSQSKFNGVRAGAQDDLSHYVLIFYSV